MQKEILNDQNKKNIDELIVEIKDFFETSSGCESLERRTNLPSIQEIKSWKKVKQRLSDLGQDVYRFYHPSKETNEVFWHFQPNVQNYEGLRQTWFQYLDTFDSIRQSEQELSEHVAIFEQWTKEFVEQVKALNPENQQNPEETEVVSYRPLLELVQNQEERLKRILNLPNQRLDILKNRIIRHITNVTLKFPQQLYPIYPIMKQQVGLSIWIQYNEYLQKIGIYVPTHWGAGMKKQPLNNFLNPDFTMSEPAPKAMLEGTVREILAPAYFKGNNWEDQDLLTRGIIIYYNSQVR